MLKPLLLLIAICTWSNSYSQETLARFENDLDHGKLTVKEVVPAVNQKKGDVSLFFMNSKQVFGYLLNDKFEVVKRLASEDRRRKYNTIIGYSVKDDLSYNLYLTNNKKNKFAAINFSFEDGNATLNEFKISNYHEKFVQTATINNRFYLISILANSSTLNFYTFDDIYLTRPKKLELKEAFFVNRRNERTSLYNLLTVRSSGAIKGIDVQKVDQSTPNSIDVTSEESKLYVKNNTFTFTFDNNRNLVQILTINPEDFSYSLKVIGKPLKSEKTLIKKSNSFIVDSKIFTIASTRKNMEFHIQDYNSGTSIKEIKLNVKDSIIFKNTPIIQEGGAYASYRELEGTKKFLRKLTAGDLGISAYRQNNQYLVTIGSEKEIARNGGMMMMPMGGFGGFPTASIGSVNVFFNPVFFAYNAYSYSKSVHIKSLFDLDFNHIDGDIEDNFFDRIKNHADPGSLSAAKTIFKYKDYFVLGNYISKPKIYILKRFDD